MDHLDLRECFCDTGMGVTHDDVAIEFWPWLLKLMYWTEARVLQHSSFVPSVKMWEHLLCPWSFYNQVPLFPSSFLTFVLLSLDRF